MSGFNSAIASAQQADVVIMVMGLGTCEGAADLDCVESEGRDRANLNFPGLQSQLISAIVGTGKPIVLVLMNGGPIYLTREVLSPSIPSIVEAWYSGEEAGHALADMLFINPMAAKRTSITSQPPVLSYYSPAGRLPMTVPLDSSQLPSYTNLSMQAVPGRTYRYSQVVPLYSFGYGLSFTTFAYSADTPVLVPNTLYQSLVTPNDSITVSATVRNVGSYNGDEVVQVYAAYISTNISATQSIPISSLVGFTRLHIAVKQTVTVDIRVNVDSLQLMNSRNTEMSLLIGEYLMYIGGSSPGSRGAYVDGDNHHELWLTHPQTLQRIHVPRSIADGLVAILTVNP